MKIYLFNEGGQDSIGDNLINYILIKLFNEIDYKVISRKYYSYFDNECKPTWKSSFLSLINDVKSIYESDLVHLGGGNLIMDTRGYKWSFHHAWIAIWCKIFRRRYYYTCIGSNPLQYKLSSLFYKYALRNAYKISARDNVTKAYIESMTNRDDIQIIYDPVLLAYKYFPISKIKNDKRRVGICPIKLYPYILNDYILYEKYIEVLSTIIKSLTLDNEVILFINDHLYDKEIYNRLRKQLLHLGDKISYVDEVQNEEEYNRFISSLDFVISSRLHGCITPNSYKIPCIGLSWQPKFINYFKDLNLEGSYEILNKLELMNVQEISSEIINLFHHLKDTNPKLNINESDLIKYLTYDR